MSIRITASLARGYGVSFREGFYQDEKDRDLFYINSGNVRLSTLHMAIQDDGICYPMMCYEKEAVIAIAFYIWMPNFGWKQVKLSALTEDFKTKWEKALREGSEIEVPVGEPVINTSKLEKIPAWSNDGKGWV